ncbi:nitroreductase family protein [Porphyromonas levii]|uniref:nitroreductase family protein n=1 Tax=Porphyromonas levii TaxID=28114 RepID=UPI001DF90382|nr:nitroreductase family protein [Porphyromonas levii]MBR8702567.1 hypothetical protein [Porphyromonas levii]MBR8765674.1 hypothetical protein [Porphyromonas levii]MBR8769160.1 hypothetical protein [Porphyromonas levii]MBR8784572.1 hypothetical protein [Porphyromonas levii]MBR8802652.1 hypothetical protein [Porphyromonas levii]
MMNKNIEKVLDVALKRRSHYALGAEWVSPQEEVEDLLKAVLRGVPTHFNSQSVRMVLLTGDAHRKHWELVERILIEQIGEELYNTGTKAKIHDSFMSGVGTVLFFEESTITEGLSAKMPLYAANFAKWAQQVQGSHQWAVWLGLTELGFGASLQHYIGIDDAAIKAQVGAPEAWEFIAHMPFGKPLDTPEVKPKTSMDELLKVLDK